MDVQREFLYLQLVGKVVNLALQRIGEEDGRLDGALAEAGGAGLCGVYVHGRTYTLPGDLHQAELAQRQDVVPGSVLLHVVAHALVEFLPVFGFVHVDEVHHDDASHIPQPELACQFVGGTEVDFQGIGFLPVGVLGAVAAVHIHHVECFGVLDDEVCAALVRDGLSER